jgi:phage-related protein (TIGR01555 family)
MSTKKIKNSLPKEDVKLMNELLIAKNSLESLTTQLSFNQSQLSKPDTITINSNTQLISLQRTTLTYAYSTFGILQKFIDQPVEDAFRGGIKIQSGELDADNINDIQKYLTEHNILQEVKDLAKWTSLYGGGGMIINTPSQKGDKPLNINAINKNTNLSFKAADLWELSPTNLPPQGENKPYSCSGYFDPSFMYYGTNLDRSRILLSKGKTAPSLIKPTLRGWGMSVVEKVIRSLNQYIKNNDLIFEMLDEAKIDVYGIKDFNSSLQVEGGADKLAKNLQMMNQVKNYQNAIVKDQEDDYEQKQMNFGGLSEMLQQIRIGIAADLSMPMTKLFGLSASGFNSGEDDIENYNSMIESEYRGKFDHIITQMLQLICKKLFDFIPDDLRIDYYPLRILGAEEEERVKAQQLSSVLQLYDRGLITSKEVKEELNQLNIFVTDLESDNEEDFPVPPSQKFKPASQDGVLVKQNSLNVKNLFKKKKSYEEILTN